MKKDPNIKRCAIYTRKSTTHGLDEQRFTSLDAQEESCLKYIGMHEAEGWVHVESFSDAGISGSTTDRPGLRSLRKAVDGGEVDVVLVYKLDRLSRSLLDFCQLTAEFEEKGVSFVSVTQSFDSSQPMGRFAMRLLSSFAELEREMITERIANKIQSTREAGLWGGGLPPLGYRQEKQKLIPVPEHAELVKTIFKLYASGLTFGAICSKMNAAGKYRPARTDSKRKTHPNGMPWTTKALSDLLNQKIYTGVMTHKDKEYPGQHEPLVSMELWQSCQDRLDSCAARRRLAKDEKEQRKRDTVYPLRGLLYCSHCGAKMRATYTISHGRLHRYYFCPKHKNKTNGKQRDCPTTSIPADSLEDIVTSRLAYLKDNETFVRVVAEKCPGHTLHEVSDAFYNFDLLLKLFNLTEKQEILHLAFKRVDYSPSGELTIHRNSLLPSTYDSLSA